MFLCPRSRFLGICDNSEKENDDDREWKEEEEEEKKNGQIFLVEIWDLHRARKKRTDRVSEMIRCNK